MKNTYLVFILLILGSCSNSANKDKQNIDKINPKVDSVKQKSLRNIVYSEPVIIWVRPTENELDSILNEKEKEGNNTFEEDAGYYNTTAQSFLNQNKSISKYVVNDSTNIYRFILKGDTIVVDKNSLRDCPWKIILFNGKEKPIIVAPVDIEVSYQNYFKK
ncbi:hypothetical protein [uncultured Acetobacteroides sp.]|uniref:hypothetical protein n=1 Tax=uncultured Acetobacteroides sp. TaxID=1760811 RepID=UPI0029F56BBD|nr:hypothetical protein [uncultured Acetobacteroides sp.]